MLYQQNIYMIFHIIKGAYMYVKDDAGYLKCT